MPKFEKYSPLEKKKISTATDSNVRNATEETKKELSAVQKILTTQFEQMERKFEDCAERYAKNIVDEIKTLLQKYPENTQVDVLEKFKRPKEDVFSSTSSFALHLETSIKAHFTTYKVQYMKFDFPRWFSEKLQVILSCSFY